MKTLILMLSITGLLQLGACSSGKKAEDPNKLITNAQMVPAAQGRVETYVDRNGNTNLLVQVKHLAEPSAIAPGASGYVVWVQPSGTENFQNVGTLKVNENLEGTHKTSVPYKNFKLIVTPENDTMAQSPTGATVLEKRVNL